MSPEGAKALLDAGYIVRVEKCPNRIYKIEEFAAAGAEIVETGSWTKAPKEDIILGLKELDPDGSMSDGRSRREENANVVAAPLPNTYIHFAHVFKKQHGWATELSRFSNAGGLLYDLEFLEEGGRRVAAFGKSAGFAGTALALLSWAQQILRPGVPLGPAPVVDSTQELIDLIKKEVKEAVAANNGESPKVIIVGALGRCGTGAIDCLNAVGIPQDLVTKWDLAETSRGGPFAEIANSDIFVNAVYLGANPAPPFVTFESLSGPDRRLRVISDVSCDPNSENNPIRIYSTHTSFENPTTLAEGKLDGPELRIIAIDHLPTLIAREASDEYSGLLLPSLLTLNRRDTEGVWTRAEKTYRDRVAELP